MNKLKDFMIRRRYSPRTIEVYTSLVRSYLSVLKNRNADDLTDEDIGRYITRFYVQAGHSRSYQNQAVNSLKLFYKTEYNREIGKVISLRPKREHKLPHVLSQKEVQAILSSFTNSKHKTIFYLIYSGGLRISEVTSLKL
ncbi:phage integrase N-terminal SAM-like domain-containing protein, partial [Balneolaceae bacterium ANBcel3]|nr:phage integrase N-terminal SAM-like domain-containing protein [Balneolaceae bacterium ANBcel3]